MIISKGYYTHLHISLCQKNSLPPRLNVKSNKQSDVLWFKNREQSTTLCDFFLEGSYMQHLPSIYRQNLHEREFWRTMIREDTGYQKDISSCSMEMGNFIWSESEFSCEKILIHLNTI